MSQTAEDSIFAFIFAHGRPLHVEKVVDIVAKRPLSFHNIIIVIISKWVEMVLSMYGYEYS